MDQEVPVLTSYLNEGATSAVFTTIEGEADNQPAFPLDPETFRQLCVEQQNNLVSISMKFEDFDGKHSIKRTAHAETDESARREFIDIYKSMKRTWENENL